MSRPRCYHYFIQREVSFKDKSRRLWIERDQSAQIWKSTNKESHAHLFSSYQQAYEALQECRKGYPESKLILCGCSDSGNVDLAIVNPVKKNEPTDEEFESFVKEIT